MQIASMLILGSIITAELPWQKRHAEGWAWYHDFEKEIEKEEPKDELVIIKTAKEDLERALAKAMLDPTKENVYAYMTLQKQWSDQARNFSKSWQYNLLEHPEVASLLPTTQYGVKVRKELDAQVRSELIKNLSKENILLFFYEGGNAYSSAFAKVVITFLKQNQWTVKPISIDGIFLKEFPRSISDRSIAKEMNVNFFPALLLVNIRTQSAVPISYGMTSISQIEENIVMQFTGESTW